MEMEVGDCSLWHYLIFCEEFVSDDYENDVVCWVCQATVLGHPAFKCLECHFFQHKSCTQLPDLTEMEDEHDITKRHHLIMREEMKNNKKEKEVCMGCGKVASGTAFKCSVPQCTFHLHKSCDQLPHAMQHIVHPDHILLLKLPSSYVSCNLCGKYRQRHPLLYNCCLCNFDGDVKCVFRSKVPDNCHPHTFTGSRKPHKFTCEACGEETEDIVHQCRDCGVRNHTWCTRFPDISRIKIHNHLFART